MYTLKLITFIYIITSYGCFSQKKNNNNDISAFKFTVTIPAVSQERKLLSIIDSTIIWKNNEYEIYEKFYTSYSENKDSMSETILKNYYIFRNGDLFGKQYSYKLKYESNFKVDSFLKQQIFDKTSGLTEMDTLVYKKQDANILVEKFYKKKLLDESYSDSTFITYDLNLRNENFSISKKLDSSSNSKTIKIIHFYKPNHSFYGLSFTESRIIGFEMELHPLADSAIIYNLIKKYGATQ
jgi:hypothetical protein